MEDPEGMSPFLGRQEYINMRSKTSHHGPNDKGNKRAIEYEQINKT